MDFRQIDVLLQKYLAGTCTPDEKQKVEAFYKQFNLAESPDFNSDKVRLVAKRLRDHLEHDLIKTDEPKILGIQKYWKYAVAASITLLLGVGFSFWFKSNLFGNEPINYAHQVSTIFINNDQTTKTVDLSDGSTVLLEPNAKLRIAFDSLEKKRIVFLEGEAFFKVAHDTTKPFLVYTESIVTKVLGTSFRVRSYKADAHDRVTVAEGKVSVSSSHSTENNETFKPIIVLPNQMATYNKKTRNVETKIIEEPSVIKGYTATMLFEDALLKDVFKDLQHAYGITIEFEEPLYSSCRLTSSFDKENLYQRLTIICSAMGTSYKVAGNKIIMGVPHCSPVH